MSFTHENLKDIGAKPGTAGTLVVTVSPKTKNPVFPRTIELTNVVHTVIWRCEDLPPQARLQILFRRNPDGPFLDLVAFDEVPNEVTGYGNRGPEDSFGETTYEAKIIGPGGFKRLAGRGRVINNATERVNDPRGGGLGEPPPVKDPPLNP